MITVRSLLDDAWYQRYKRICNLNIRSSIYDLTNRCNLRCKGCFYFSSGENQTGEVTDLEAWRAFVDGERERGVNLAILIGGEPTLVLDRVEVFYRSMPTFCASNGLIPVPRERFPEMMVGISLWGDPEAEKQLRGVDAFRISSKNYAGDPHAYYLYTITARQVGRVETMTRRIRDIGLKVHYQLLSNDEGVDGFAWERTQLAELRQELDDLLDRYPDTVVSCRYYHEVLTSGVMLGRTFGWNECPSVSETHETRVPAPRRLIRFLRWGADLKTTHRCCTSATRDCRTCKDGAAHMSWVMVNKRDHIRSAKDLQNWIEVYELFAKLYRFIPW